MFRPHLRGLAFDPGELKAYWRLSMKGIPQAAAEVPGAIDQHVATRLKQHSACGYNAIEPYSLSPKAPTLVEQAVDVRLQDHEYTPAELAKAVRLNTDEFYTALLGKGRPLPRRECHPSFPGLFSRSQRIAAAFRAISDRSFADSLAARALPPLRPPLRPSPTAAGSYHAQQRLELLSLPGSRCPRPSFASWFGSRGLRERLR